MRTTDRRTGGRPVCVNVNPSPIAGRLSFCLSVHPLARPTACPPVRPPAALVAGAFLGAAQC